MSLLSRTAKLFQPVLAVLVGLALSLLVTYFAGENPFFVLKVLAESSFGSAYDFGMTLFYATPLIFTGLSVSFAFQAGLFNIGGEGQLAFGAIAIAALGAVLPGLPPIVAPLFSIAAACLGGAALGYAAGWLRAKRGAHEVISTIMLNFIAAGLVSWITIYLLKDPESQGPETAPLSENFVFTHFPFFEGAPVTYAFFVAVVTAILCWYFLNRTVLGFEMKAIGENSTAAQFAGIDAGSIQTFALTVAGALAGMVGVAEVLGNVGEFKLGFSPGYGFTGIAVALLARAHPIGVVFSALLFGALHKGTLNLDFETENVTRDLSAVMQAIIILTVSADALWRSKGRLWKKP